MNIRKALILFTAIALCSPALGLAEIKKDYYKKSGKLLTEWNYLNGKLEGVSTWYF